MKRAFRYALIVFFVTLVINLSFAEWYNNTRAEKTIKQMPIEIETTTEKTEIVTGLCTFGDCPVVLPTTMSETSTEVVKEILTTERVRDFYTFTVEQEDNLTIEETVEYQEETEETESEVPSTLQNEEETYQQDDYSGYIGRMYITGYTAEEGFPS